MANRTCWRCLSRLSLSSSNPSQPSSLMPPSAIASFSTTPAVYRSPLNQKRGTGPQAQAQLKTAIIPKSRMRKKKVVSRGKPPAPGERKAIAKRIVLSNTNALDVPGILDLSRTNLPTEASIGTMVGLPSYLLDPLRAIEAFQPTQSWGFFKRPATLTRPETVEFAKLVDSVSPSDGTTSAESFRRIITGPAGSGKSVLLLQIQAMALQAGWVVINIPDAAAQAIILGNTAYTPLPGTNPPQYAQKNYMAGLLSRTVKANERALSSLKVLQTHEFLKDRKPNLTLRDLAALGVEDPEISWNVFQALWSELTSKSGNRPPILYSLDGLVHVCRLSEYLAPNMHNIHAFDFAIVHHYLSYLSGEAALPNGGLVIAADCASNRPATRSLDLALQQSEQYPNLVSGKSKDEVPLYDPESPYLEQDSRVLSRMRTTPTTRLSGISREEAKTLLEYFATSGMFQSTITQALVTEKWMLAGGGNLKELEKATLRRANHIR